jgi:phospholipid/cholesterol/gamma-HCH transport system ATP-binding protein
MIQLQDLYKSFRRQRVLEGVTLEIKTGETMVIIGRSGCGKSVLLKHIIGLLRPDGGTVLVEGKDVGGLSPSGLKDLRKHFGMLFQGAALFDSLTVGENVALALREHHRMGNGKVEEIVARKLKMVGLQGVESMKPAELSGGMKKRVGLARAIAMDPQYVLYDEPTTGLDPIMADKINELIRQLQKDLSITSVAVTHDMHSAYKIADRIAMLYEGRIIFLGTPQEIQASASPIVQQFIRGESSGPIEAG